MGVQITELVEGKIITLEELFDKRIAIDAFNWIYQFLSIIRQRDGSPLMDSRGRVTSHLSGLFYRTLRLLEAGIKPIYVFDGEPPALKKATAEKRKEARAEALKEWKEALERSDYEEARRQAMRSSTITDEMIEGGKELLGAMGVPCVQAQSEGEALCAAMCRRGDAYAAATQDYDSLLFGAPRLVRNLSITGKRKKGREYVEVKPEMVLLNEVLEKLGITREQLIILSILVGTDYNPGGVKGFGPKRAIELVKEKKTLAAVLGKIAWDFDAAPEEIFEFFMKPAGAEHNIEFRSMDIDTIKKILCDRHDFSAERIDSALEKVTKQKSGQKSLGRWM